MKRWLAISLLSLYLCSTTELFQFLKIPILIEHYFEHKEANPDMSVYAFLKLHYDHHVKDADYQTDQKLPFIRHHDFSSIVFIINPRISIDFSKNVHIPVFSQKIRAYNHAVLEWEVLDSIWQPPKFC